jgi:hypothetical protein
MDERTRRTREISDQSNQWDEKTRRTGGLEVNPIKWVRKQGELGD